MRRLRGGKRSTALQARDHCKQAPDAGMVSLREARCWGLWEEWPGQAHQSCQIDQYQPTGTRVSGPRALRPRLCCPAWTWRGETTSAAPEHWRPRCPSEAASCVWCALTFVIAVRRPSAVCQTDATEAGEEKKREPGIAQNGRRRRGGRRDREGTSDMMASTFKRLRSWRKCWGSALHSPC